MKAMCLCSGFSSSICSHGILRTKLYSSFGASRVSRPLRMVLLPVPAAGPMWALYHASWLEDMADSHPCSAHHGHPQYSSGSRGRELAISPYLCLPGSRDIAPLRYCTFSPFYFKIFFYSKLVTPCQLRAGACCRHCEENNRRRPSARTFRGRCPTQGELLCSWIWEIDKGYECRFLSHAFNELRWSQVKQHNLSGRAWNLKREGLCSSLVSASYEMPDLWQSPLP